MKISIMVRVTVEKNHIVCGNVHTLTIIGRIEYVQVKSLRHQFVYDDSKIYAIGYSQHVGARVREFSAGNIQLLEADFRYKFEAIDINNFIIAASDDEIVVIPVHNLSTDDFFKQVQAKMLKSLIQGDLPEIDDLYQ